MGEEGIDPRPSVEDALGESPFAAEREQGAGLQRTLTLTSNEGDDTAGLLKDVRLSSSLTAEEQKLARSRNSKVGPSNHRQNNGWKETPSRNNPPFSRGASSASFASLVGNFATDAKTSTWYMLLGTKMNILLACVPFAIASHKCSWGSGLTAVLSLLSLCPLAERLGFTTEQLALRTNDTLGALLNVTFGNATELILSVVALKESEITLIQLSLIGSILSNQLLVLGSSMVIGGLKHGVQLFERQSAVIHVSLLVGSSLALLMPMLIHYVGDPETSERTITWLSRLLSIVMVTAYGLFLFYILRLEKQSEQKNKNKDKTKQSPLPAVGETATPEKFSILHKSSLHHSHLSAQMNLSMSSSHRVCNPGDVELGMLRLQHKPAVDLMVEEEEEEGDSGRTFESSDLQLLKEEEEEEEPVISTCSGVFWLGVVAIFISYMSDILVASIEDGAAEKLHVPSGFLYTIIVPIVGNAAEHTSALIFSYRNKPDIAFGIAVGSSVQIALLVIPACVLIAWPMQKLLTLDFHAFETSIYAASVILLMTVVNDGRSNWMKGALLIAAYAMIGLGVWFV
jgi:Ca2+:H+ antiporter